MDEKLGLLFSGRTYIEFVGEQGTEENLRNVKLDDRIVLQ
jgi:hypothetical protein